MRIRVAAFGLALLTCAGSAVTQTDPTVANIVGFEDAQYWHVIEGTGPLSMTPALSEGEFALQVGGGSWRQNPERRCRVGTRRYESHAGRVDEQQLGRVGDRRARSRGA